MPGVIAAYQPVGAPGPLPARYNMAREGRNGYRAEPGVLPTWAVPIGWTFNGTTQYLNTGYIPVNDRTLLVAFTNASGAGFSAGARIASANDEFDILPRGGSGERSVRYGDNLGANEHLIQVAGGALTSGVYGFSWPYAYLNGVLETGGSRASFGTTTASPGVPMFIGAVNNNTTPTIGPPCSIQAVLIVRIALAPAVVWTISRQMAYCHVNPEWNAWASRRRWFYAAGGAEPDLGIAITDDNPAYWVTGPMIGG